MSTTPLIDSLAIAHLDFQPGCEIPLDECPDPATALISMHACLVECAFVRREWTELLVCKKHLDHCRQWWNDRPGPGVECHYCGAVFTTFSDLINRIVPL